MVMGLVFLLILTFLGVAALGGNVLEERMAGNSRDVGMAFQAAEAALRDGEADVSQALPQYQIGDFSASCANGLCATPANSSTPWWQANPQPGWRTYGSYTNRPALPGICAQCQPVYIIEQPSSVPSANQGTGRSTPSNGWGYRITAIGYGNQMGSNGKPVTQVVLQSVYVPYH